MMIKQNDTFYSHSKEKTIINESTFDNVFKSIYTKITSSMQNSVGKGSGWVIDSLVENNINTSKYNPLAGSYYIKLPK